MPNNLYFKDWYAKHKDRLSKARKEKYRTDPVYRERALAAAAEARKNRERAPKPEGKTFAQAAEALGVSAWTIDRWHKEKFFPTPVKVSGAYYLSDAQVQLIARVRDFFLRYPKRAAALHRGELEEIINVIAHNWEV